MAAPYGDVIRKIRKQKGLSQGELANRASLHRDTVVRAEQSGNVGVLFIYQIASALDVHITELFSRKGGAVAHQAAAPSEPDVFSRLKPEQRARVEKLARGMLGEERPEDLE